MLDFPKYKGKGGLMKPIMHRLVLGARCAIKMHGKTGDLEKLRVDLRNGPNHFFNNHQHCSPIFCKVAASTSESDEVSWTDSIK